MGTLEDIRKVMQDFLAPELRALSEKIDGLDRRINTLEKHIEERFKSAENLATERHLMLVQMLDLNRRVNKIEDKIEKPN